MTFEERVARAAEEKLSDGTVEKLVGECVEKAVKTKTTKFHSLPQYTVCTTQNRLYI